ncbi:MAG: thioesterase family protein [Burkholderiaceae bacterium]
MTTFDPGQHKPRSAAEQRKIEAAVRELFNQRISFNQYLGMTVDKLGTDEVSIVFDMRPELVGHYLFGQLHGGVTSAVLDATGGLACLWGVVEKYKHEDADTVMHRFGRLGTVDLRVDYLLKGIGERFTATARVVRLGGRIAWTRMELHSETGAQIAAAAGAYIVS